MSLISIAESAQSVSCKPPHLGNAGCFLQHAILERRFPGLAIGEARAAIARDHPLTLVVTQGALGAAAADDAGACFVAAEPTEPADLTGGGDAFAAAFLDGWTRGSPLPACLAAGLRLARNVIAHVGARY